jgi:hypothetical protein
MTDPPGQPRGGCPDPAAAVTLREIARQIAAGPPRSSADSAVDALASRLAAGLPCRQSPSCTRLGIPRMACEVCREDAYTAALAAAAGIADLARASRSPAGITFVSALLTAPPPGPACRSCGHPVMRARDSWWHTLDGTLAQPPGRGPEPGRGTEAGR